jgi:hypothetical protein
MDVQAFCGAAPHPLLWADSRSARVRITATGIPNRLNYCVIFIVCTCFANVTAGRIIQLLGSQVGYPYTGVSGPFSWPCLNNLLIYLLTYSMEQSPSWEANPFSGKKLPSFYGTRRFITTFTSARHLSLSWACSTKSMPYIPLPEDSS